MTKPDPALPSEGGATERIELPAEALEFGGIQRDGEEFVAAVTISREAFLKLAMEQPEWKELVSALKPFASYARTCEYPGWYAVRAVERQSDISPTVSDFRHAHTLLSRYTGGQS